MLYHRTAAEACEEALVELIDYCYRKFVTLTQRMDEGYKPGKESAKDLIDKTNLQDLERNFDEIEFTCTMTCLSLIRFITDHMDGLPASIIHQLMENNDIPLVLVPLLELKPWYRKNAKGEEEKFEDHKWSKVEPHEKGKLTKLEAQIWLTIYNMFMTQASN